MANRLILSVFFLVAFLYGINVAQADDTNGLNFTVHAVVLDGISSNFVQSALTDAGNFIHSHSSLSLSSTVSETSLPHSYTHFGDKIDLRINDLDPGVLQNLPIADFYIFFYKTNGQPPLNAGSTYGIDLTVNGVAHPYASIPSDMWWFNDSPFEGIPSRKGQIITHELNNQINEVLIRSPYLCNEMTATGGLPANQYESDRLAHLDSNCYQNIQSNPSHNPNTDPAPHPRPNFSVNMSAGSTDISTIGQVTLLQDFLRATGYFKRDSSGYFGLITKAAAINFQTRNGIIPVRGFVGPITRARISSGNYVNSSN